jgi:hypothetical protein
MSNGKMDSVELSTLKSAPVDEKLDYVVTCAYETKQAIEALPQTIEAAIRRRRRRDLAFVGSVASAIAVLAGLISPYLLRICF